MGVRRVYDDGPKETYVLVQEPGRVVITADCFVHGSKNGLGITQARGKVTLDFGEGIGIATVGKFEIHFSKLEVSE